MTAQGMPRDSAETLGGSGPEGLASPVAIAMRQIIEAQEQRHEWLIRAGEQIRKWKAEDQAASKASTLERQDYAH